MVSVGKPLSASNTMMDVVITYLLFPPDSRNSPGTSWLDTYGCRTALTQTPGYSFVKNTTNCNTAQSSLKKNRNVVPALQLPHVAPFPIPPILIKSEVIRAIDYLQLITIKGECSFEWVPCTSKVQNVLSEYPSCQRVQRMLNYLQGDTSGIL